MMVFLGVVAFAVSLVNTFILYQLLKLFFPMRGFLLFRIAAFFPCYIIIEALILPQNIVRILFFFVCFLIYINLFYKGSVIRKTSVVIILYPLIAALNYFVFDIGSRIILTLPEQTEVYAKLLRIILSFGLQTSLWIVILQISKKRLVNFVDLLNTKMWLVLDGISVAVFASLIIVLSFMPDAPEIGYPVALASIVTVFSCLYFIGYIAESIRTEFQLEVLQKEHQHFEAKLKDEERVRTVYHDMKNHLLLLQAIEHTQQASEMLVAMQKQISGYENYHKTGNTFLDIIVKDKAEKAIKHDIDFSVMLHFEEGQFIEPMDISTIFGNALDNAIEASLKLPSNKRMITAKANRIEDMFYIVIENNVVSEAGKTLKTTKQDKLLHGLGLRNIANSIEKYEGQYAIKRSNDRFILTIIIPIP
jgi:hypothetical protein